MGKPGFGPRATNTTADRKDNRHEKQNMKYGDHRVDGESSSLESSTARW